MEFSKKLRQLRLKSHLTQEKLGRELGVSVITIRNWESGAKLPSMQAIISLAKTLDISADELLGITKPPAEVPDTVSLYEYKLLTKYRELDHFGKKAVDKICNIELARVKKEREDRSGSHNQTYRPERFIQKYLTPSAAGVSFPLDGDDFEMMLVDDAVPANADFAVVIQGNSMEPYINDGDVVFVKKQQTLDAGDIGIFSVDGAMYCKLFYKDAAGNVTLVSANPEYESSNVVLNANSNSSLMCYGKVLLQKPVPIPDYFEDNV